MSLCLAACGAWAVADRMAVEQEPPLGYVAQLCVGVNALPAWQIGRASCRERV